MSFETGEWSLAKDKELIDKLEERSAKFLSSLANVPKDIDQLATETAQLNLLLQNVIGDLNILSEKRFAENRVAEAHDEPKPPTPDPQPQPATEEELRLAVKNGLRAFGLLPIQELSDSDDGLDDYEFYTKNRPFSLIIGTKEWQEADPFEGVTPVETKSVGDTAISEAMEELVLPTGATSYDDVEEATEAEAWYQQERASVAKQGTTASNIAENVVPEATQSTLPPLPSDNLEKHRGLFDEDSDDGDLFGVVKKPYIVGKTSALSSGQSTPVAAGSRRGSGVSLLQDILPPEPESPLSFLDELKKKTERRNSGKPDSPPVQSPVAKKSNELPDLPKLPSDSPVKKRNSLLDSDIFVTKPPKPTASALKTSETLPKSGKAPSRKFSLLDSDSEDNFEEQLKSELPKVTNVTLPFGGKTLPTLPRRESLFDDSDSDSDIFKPQKAVQEKISEKRASLIDENQPLRPKDLKGIQVLPSLPGKLLKKSDPPGEFNNGRKPSLVTPLESVVKPQSDSENEIKHTLPAVRPKQLATKQLNLFGDSDSDDDLFGRPAVSKKKETIANVVPIKVPVEVSEVSASEKLKENRISVSKESKKIEVSTPKESKEVEVPRKSSLATKPVLDQVSNVNSGVLIVDQQEKVEPIVEKSEKISVVDQSGKSEDIFSDSDELFLSKPSQGKASAEEIKKVVGEPVVEDADEAKQESGQAHSFSTSSESSSSLSDGDFRQKLKSTLSKPTKQEVSEEGQVERSESEIVDLDLKKDSTEETVETTEKSETMAEKGKSVKQIGMGLPAGFLQGLKARQQQMGIAQPEAKRSKTPEAEPDSLETKNETPETPLEVPREHKDILVIAKTRARGPTGRRLPSRSSRSSFIETQKTESQTSESIQTEKASESEPKTQVENRPTPDQRSPEQATEKNQKDDSESVEKILEENPLLPKSSESTEDAPKRKISLESLKDENPQKNDSKKEESEKSSLEERKKSKDQTQEQLDQSKGKPTQRKSIFASDSSEEDLFSPKAPPRKKSFPQESQEKNRPVAKATVAIVNDPLSTAFASSDETEQELEKERNEVPVAPRRSSKVSADAKPPKAKSLFSESEDDDDGQLFGKTIPKSATTSSLLEKNKPKLPASKSLSDKLFASDSDSDDLFKKK